MERTGEDSKCVAKILQVSGLLAHIIYLHNQHPGIVHFGEEGCRRPRAGRGCRVSRRCREVAEGRREAWGGTAALRGQAAATRARPCHYSPSFPGGAAAAAAPLRRDLPGIRCAAGAMTSWGGAAAPARAARAAGRGGGGCARARGGGERAGPRGPGAAGTGEPGPAGTEGASVRGRCSRCRLVLCGAACRIST